VALFHAGIAMAADAAPAAAADAASEAAPEAAQGSRLDEIVVTATKRETNLQKTPVAISVIDDKIIADRHIQSLLDLADGGVPRCAWPPSKPASRR
jgi:iron complex outermembrane receptor protein